MSKRVANRHGQPSRNRMYARGVRRAEGRVVTERRQAKDKARADEMAARTSAIEISTLKNLLATPPKKVGFFRNLFSRRGT